MDMQEKTWCDQMYAEMLKGNAGWQDLTEYQTVLMKDYIDADRQPITYEKVRNQSRASI